MNCNPTSNILFRIRFHISIMGNKGVLICDAISNTFAFILIFSKSQFSFVRGRRIIIIIFRYTKLFPCCFWFFFYFYIIICISILFRSSLWLFIMFLIIISCAFVVFIIYNCFFCFRFVCIIIFLSCCYIFFFLFFLFYFTRNIFLFFFSLLKMDIGLFDFGLLFSFLLIVIIVNNVTITNKIIMRIIIFLFFFISSPLYLHYIHSNINFKSANNNFILFYVIYITTYLSIFFCLKCLE